MVGRSWSAPILTYVADELGVHTDSASDEMLFINEVISCSMLFSRPSIARLLSAKGAGLLCGIVDVECTVRVTLTQ